MKDLMMPVENQRLIPVYTKYFFALIMSDHAIESATKINDVDLLQEATCLHATAKQECIAFGMTRYES